MTNPPPIPPIPPLDEDAENATGDVPTQDVDGERRIDPDADDSQVDSAEADRIAADGD